MNWRAHGENSQAYNARQTLRVGSEVALSARLLSIPEKDMASFGPEDPGVSLDGIIESIRTAAGSLGSPTILGPELLRIRALRDEINDPANPA